MKLSTFQSFDEKHVGMIQDLFHAKMHNLKTRPIILIDLITENPRFY